MALTNDKIFIRAIMTGDNGIVKSVTQEVEDRPGLYCIFNSETNMLYIGCSNNIRTRLVTHKRHMTNGEHICKQMSADYIKSPDSFVFFCLEYVDFSDYESLEVHRSVLLNRETQYMKRVPHVRLYNNSVPVSLSEKMLLSDIPADRIKIHVSDIFRRLEMSPDSIRANGYTIQDELTLPEAIEFVRKRTVANGRWPQEKADLAVAYLAELEAQKGGGIDSESALQSFGQFDYFGDYVVKVPNMAPARREWGWREFVLLALAFAPALASMRNMRNITHAISGNETDAVLITAVLSMAPVGFIVAGVRGRPVIGLSVLLILYESFCNLTRIYGGLMNVGKSGYPTRFLGLVTDIFNSGSHGTAIALAAFTAFFIAAVQYAAVFELNKK